jgi:predicted aconitase with swiveling domain
MSAIPTQPDRLFLTDAFVPRLTAGTYTLTAKQTLILETEPPILETEPPPPRTSKEFKLCDQKTFSVAAPRFSLDPDEIYSVYPPDGSSGGYASTVPHVVLRRKTLPWERKLSPGEPPSGQPPAPWMALLLFDEDELAKYPFETRSLTELVGFGFKLEPWEEKPPPDANGERNNRCRTLDIPWKLFRSVSPREDELRYLAHTRGVFKNHKEDVPGIGDGWFSVILANRLPTPKVASASEAPLKHNVAVLISLEGLTDLLKPNAPKGAEEIVHLIVLATWSFMSTGPSFRDRVKALHSDSKEPTTPGVLNTTAQVETLTLDSYFTTTDSLTFTGEPPNTGGTITGIGATTSASVLQGLIAALPGFSGTTVSGDPGGPYTITFTKALGRVATSRDRDLWLRAPVPAAKVETLTLDSYFTTTDSLTFIGEPPNTGGTITGIGATTSASVLQGLIAALPGFSGTTVSGNPGGPYTITFTKALGRVATSRDRDLWLRAPVPAANGAVQTALKLGYAPLPHNLRQGSRTVSWYRGPLVPVPDVARTVDKIFVNADAALQYDKDTGLFDVSYAAAWQLGRLLALQAPEFAWALFLMERGYVADNLMKEAEKQFRALFNQAPDLKRATRMLQDDLMNAIALEFSE